MKELVIATGNQGKLAEITAVLRAVVGNIYSLADFPALPQTIEDGDTFAANAIKKARVVAQATGFPALADDSGLVVPALGGRPGVHSARFAGEQASDADNNSLLLSELANCDITRRQASFVCVMALCFPNGDCHTFSGKLQGVVLTTPQGNGGFGYDPLFLVPECAKTLAELDMASKTALSHRGKALAALLDFLLSEDSVA